MSKLKFHPQPQHPAVQFKLIYNEDPAFLENDVNEYLKDGWTLHGAPFILANGDVAQAVVS